MVKDCLWYPSVYLSCRSISTQRDFCFLSPPSNCYSRAICWMCLWPLAMWHFSRFAETTHIHLKIYQAVTGILISQTWRKSMLTCQNIWIDYCIQGLLSCSRHKQKYTHTHKYRCVCVCVSYIKISFSVPRTCSIDYCMPLLCNKVQLIWFYWFICVVKDALIH